MHLPRTPPDLSIRRGHGPSRHMIDRNALNAIRLARLPLHPVTRQAKPSSTAIVHRRMAPTPGRI
ncbi:hypothetical protein GGR75_003100 [Xanthomonas campestris]|nr:hypothetical protein [Xanthomonas campestris]MCW2005474.1 hypothetical protein [Xanthomonas campestris]MEC5196568.1 hypothetical protein [Xanthomonas campestris]